MDNGKGSVEKDMEFKPGLMELDIKEIGIITKHLDEESSFMLIMIFMMENGATIKPMAMESMSMPMAQGMKDIGKMIIKMAMDNNNGQMEVHMLESINKGKNMDKEHTSGEIQVFSKANG